MWLSYLSNGRLSCPRIAGIVYVQERRARNGVQAPQGRHYQVLPKEVNCSAEMYRPKPPNALRLSVRQCGAVLHKPLNQTLNQLVTLVQSPLRTSIPHHVHSTKRAVKLTAQSVATIVEVGCDSIRDIMSSLQSIS